MIRRWTVAGVLALVGCLGALSGLRAQDAAPQRVQDVIYGRKDGVALTLDVFKPAKPSGVGVLWMVSGGWFSSHDAINPGMMQPFLDRGETVFAVVHGSQPKFTIPEILQDIDRATRFVRYHAREYGVDPDRLAISGGSAGGHLSLMQGARGHDGDPNAKDPVDRVNSRVQAVACFFPPTDFLNYGSTGVNALTDETLKQFWVAFGYKSREPAELERVARADSPLYLITKAMPPTLIIHGDADKLVPIQQAQILVKKLNDAGVEAKLVTKPGAAHGWADQAKDMVLIADWFDAHLKKSGQ